MLFQFDLLGCSKCDKEFPRLPAADGKTQLKADYSGFIKQSWPPRLDNVHKNNAKLVSKAKTLQQKKSLEKEHGARWSVLYELPYFEPVGHHSIDPMHCIFLGICKRFMKLLFKLELLTERDAKDIQRFVDKMRVPSAIGRIPRKINSKFSSLTADEWKNWTLIFSSICLKDRLPSNIYQIWMVFVKAVSILCERHLKASDIIIAEDMLWRFAQAYELQFGKGECTPNLHMLCHLPDVIRDYGPVYAFWCYSFERYKFSVKKCLII